MKIAAQLYTVRDFTQTPAEIEKTLKKVKKIGYDAVQVSGFGPIEAVKLKELVDEIGLEICATHISFDRLKNDLDNVIKEHKLWNCKQVGLGIMPEEYRSSADGIREFLQEIAPVAKKLKENELQFIYHNHNVEFANYGDKTGMDILLEESDPDFFDFEIDTYWIQAGGADPAEWIKKVKNRMDVVHFKDMTVDGWDPQMAEVGEGNLNWPRIIKACSDNQVEWACVEQDVCQRDPFESLAISLQNLKAMGL
ncbi:sugar phosphate isomerase/epimerase [Halanaerobium saccharolyticum]|jgi:sugar phosphate isomerase/epimerase|uniref:Sugar phosphate isomerase/epimerase n=1 Tax=Halanaerobium saccharolyticum TaxID=43595 RepID=A0A4R7YQ16_9FIRM|nr:sugar phosphate isomerase/epimerase [Halanaerobium saccharolyticum]RAK05461.1 sugar phosphate isomerase/epimerase [Halanaerobium saccharolyticum]TDV99796.1 sugar phosphate isomerase/epimerase [Halanaerobium saccharolyticum]TDX52018.1 sugar phosphate isomerase/epimerase [Halanaerobium saccharolyticum]